MLQFSYRFAFLSTTHLSNRTHDTVNNANCENYASPLMGLPVNMAPFSKEDKILSMNVQLKHLMRCNSFPIKFG